MAVKTYNSSPLKNLCKWVSTAENLKSNLFLVGETPSPLPLPHIFGCCSHIGWATKAALVKFNKQYGKAMGCLPSYLGRQCEGFEGFGMGRSKDETRVAMWTLEKQGREKRIYKLIILAFCLLAFYVLFAMLQMWWIFFSSRIMNLSALSVNLSLSIKKNLFVFQFLKALVHQHNWFWPFLCPLLLITNPDWMNSSFDFVRQH